MVLPNFSGPFSTYISKLSQLFFITIIKLLYLQLFLTLLSLPVCAYWGIPFALLTPLGNLLFVPYMSIFLGCATVTFFCALCHIPLSIPAYFLETIHDFWFWSMNLLPHGPLIGCMQPSLWVVVLMLFAACLSGIIIKKSYYHALFLAMLLCVFGIIYIPWYPYQPYIMYVSYKKHQIPVVIAHDCVVVIDCGKLNRMGIGSFLQYTLIQEITKKSGHTHIDYLICCKPSSFLLCALEEIAATNNIKQVILPQWYGKIPYTAWNAYKALRNNPDIAITQIQHPYVIAGKEYTIRVIPQSGHQWHNAQCSTYVVQASLSEIHYAWDCSSKAVQYSQH